MTGNRDGRPLVIGITGGSGSGKTTIAHAMADEIGKDSCAHILHDAYYRDLTDMAMEDRAQVNYDHPDSLETELLVEHLHALIHGAAVGVPIYDFAVHNRSTEVDHIEPRPVILIEGVLALDQATLREVMDLKIYVDTASDLRFMRRLERDLSERAAHANRSTSNTWPPSGRCTWSSSSPPSHMPTWSSPRATTSAP
jgi:uridine kinase